VCNARTRHVPDRLVELVSEGCARFEAILLGGHHLDELHSADDDGPELPGVGVGKRPGGGIHGSGEAGEVLDIESVDLGESTRDPSEVSGLCGVAYTDSDPTSGERPGVATLEAAAGFEDQEGRALIFEHTEKLVEPFLVVGDDERFPGREECPVQAGLANVHPYATRFPASGPAQSISPFPLPLPAILGLPNLAGTGSEQHPDQATVWAPPGVSEGRDDPRFHTASIKPRRQRSVAPTPLDFRPESCEWW
jgi:hypothetical protein